MKKKLRFILPILFVALVLCAGFYFWLYPTRGPHEAVDMQKAFLEEIDGTKVLHLKGTPYEMGFQRGVLLKDVIHHSLARFDELLELAKKEVGLPKFAAKLILDVTWRLCSPHIPLRYSRELEGIADGAGVNLQDLRRVHVVSVITERGCSSFAVWGKATADGKMYHGRNFDWIMEAGIQDTAVTFCYEPQGLNSFVSVGYACAIGVLSGMNNRKVSIAQIGATNKDRRIDGTPLEFLLRQILEECSTLDQVTEIIQKARHTVGYNYVIADGDENRALAYETCAHHVAIFTDNDPRETVEYAIPIENAVMRADEAMDPTIRSLQTCANAPNMPYGSNSYDHRYKGMATRIKENYGKIDQNIALEILKAVAMVNTNLHSVLYCPTDLELWVAHAKGTEDAAKQPYVHYKMKELFDPTRKEKLSSPKQTEEKPYFVASEKSSGEYLVDTGSLKGTFRFEGRSIGFVPFFSISPELEISANPTALPGLFNFYRVFVTNQRFGESMRSVQSKTELLDGKTMKVLWEADEAHPFVLSTVYQWVNPQTLDLHISVEAKQTLPDFEIFLSSYLTDKFPESYVYAQTEEGDKFLPTPMDAGVWQAFPRDEQAISIIRDGRWAIPPSPVDWAIRPFYKEPIIYRMNSDTKVAVVQMAQKKDCFAVLTPHAGEQHYSMYFSLFGKTLETGQIVSTTVRMIITPMSEEQILTSYQEFISSNKEQ